MDSLKLIGIAVDFSISSAGAFREAARIAEWNRSSLAALHVVPLPSLVATPHPLFPFPLPTQADFAAESRQLWERFVPDCAGRAGASFSVEVGSPREAILEWVRSTRPDLLVLGAQSASESRRGIGPTAAACMQRAETNVLLVREDHAGPFRRVLACLDFTATSRTALEHAVRLAAQDGAALHILHVYDDPWFGMKTPVEIEANMPDFKSRLREAVEARMRQFCEPLVHEINALKGTFHAVEFVWRGSGYGHAITEFVKQEKCDLVVLGTRDKWNVRDFLFGSTAERVIRGVPCSILAIKPERAG